MKDYWKKLLVPDYSRDKCFGKSYIPMIQCGRCSLRDTCLPVSRDRALAVLSSPWRSMSDLDGEE